MKLSAFIEQLKLLPPDADVFVQDDRGKQVPAINPDDVLIAVKMPNGRTWVLFRDMRGARKALDAQTRKVSGK